MCGLFFFFVNEPASTEIYTLSLHDALPISTSRQNTKDQVYAQNEMLAYQQKESTARVASIMENTNLSKQQQVSEIMRQMLTQAQTATCCCLERLVFSIIDATRAVDSF